MYPALPYTVTNPTKNRVFVGNKYVEGYTTDTVLITVSHALALASQGWRPVRVQNINGNWEPTSHLNKTLGAEGEYTLNSADSGYLIIHDSGDDVTVTVSDDDTINWPVNSVIQFVQIGAGAVIIEAEDGVTIVSKGDSLTSDGTGSGIKLVKVGKNKWWLSGDLVVASEG